MAQTSNIRFRCPKKLRARAQRIIKVRFAGKGQSLDRKMSELGREAMTEYIERKELEFGLTQPKEAKAA